MLVESELAICVWCRRQHGGRLQLCEQCEVLSRQWRLREGLALRVTPSALTVQEEPDD